MKKQLFLDSFVRDVKRIHLIQLILFTLLGIAALQLAVFLQHGTIQSLTEYPIFIVVGALFGAFFGIFFHIIQYEARRAQNELLQKEDILRALTVSEERLSLATSRSHIWDFDVESDELFLSPGFAKSLGYSSEELKVAMQGATSNLMHPDDVERYRTKLAAHFENPSRGFFNEHRFRTKSGTYKWFVAFGQSETNADGKAVRFAGTTTDVSERVDLESQLYQAQKMDAIGKLTGGIAHDFNNLLAITMGNLELLREDIDDNDHIQMIDASLEATSRGSDLTRSMLTFAGKAQLDPKVLDLNEVVRHAKKWMHSGLPKTIDIELSLTAGLWRVQLDRTMFESAILNLLLNSKDAMNENGKLIIETANVQVDQIRFDSRKQKLFPGRYVSISVIDTGEGISKEVLQHIFDPFYTTKTVGKGTGMGLPMVVGFVRQSGGTVQIHTEQGRGTTFQLYFPAIVSPIKEKFPLVTEITNSPGHSLHVLLVDDEAAVREVLSATLKASGYRVTEAKNGDEAFALYTPESHFDVLVTDVVMPGTLDGIELAQAIRAKNPELPVVFMSGYTADAIVSGDGILQKDVLLTKPFPKRELALAVAQATGPQRPSR